MPLEETDPSAGKETPRNILSQARAEGRGQSAPSLAGRGARDPRLASPVVPLCTNGLSFQEPGGQGQCEPDALTVFIPFAFCSLLFMASEAGFQGRK